MRRTARVVVVCWRRYAPSSVAKRPRCVSKETVRPLITATLLIGQTGLPCEPRPSVSGPRRYFINHFKIRPPRPPERSIEFRRSTESAVKINSFILHPINQFQKSRPSFKSDDVSLTLSYITR